MRAALIDERTTGMRPRTTMSLFSGGWMRWSSKCWP